MNKYIWMGLIGLISLICGIIIPLILLYYTLRVIQKIHPKNDTHIIGLSIPIIIGFYIVVALIIAFLLYTHGHKAIAIIVAITSILGALTLPWTGIPFFLY